MLPLALRTVTVLLIGASVLAQSPAPGLRLFQPLGSRPTHMVDNNGNIVHSWSSGNSIPARFAPDGTLLRGSKTGYSFSAGGETGLIQKIALDGTVLWSYRMDGPDLYAHHDIQAMPNGNVMVIAWDAHTPAEAVAAGRSFHTGPQWLPDCLIELQPVGFSGANIVWAWYLMDHIVQDVDPGKPNFGVVSNHPELLDINFPPQSIFNGDWNHFNGLDYDPIHDLVVVSSRSQGEIYVIDHSTTTAEAAGHTGGLRGKGGDILYRWGNPQAYGAGTAGDQQLFGQHDTRFIPPGSPGAGNITLFNNNFMVSQSAVFELALPIDSGGNFAINAQNGRFDPVTPTWIFSTPGVHSFFVSSAERLPNGNTLVCSGAQNSLLEVTPAGQVAWAYVHPNSQAVFHAHYVPRSLWQDTTELSVGGGTVNFDHLVGSEHDNRIYMFLGSVSGTTPGTPLGAINLPLNTDYLTNAMSSTFNSGVFLDNLRRFDPLGAGTSSIVVPPNFIPPALAGLQMDFAHVIFGVGLVPLQASNPVGVTIVQ